MRHVVLTTRGTVAIMPRQRPLLEYYANSIAHLLPPSAETIHRMTPADDKDDSLHRLQEPRRRG
jgi:hypothetical protein